MSAQHTPGEWSLDLDGCVVMQGQRVIFDAAPDGASVEEARANRRLIAAAPELLEALDILRDCLEDRIAQLGHDPADDARVKLARAAIAKATGSAA